MKKGVIPSEDAHRRTSAAVKHFEGTYRNRVQRGTKKVIRRGGGCKSRNEIWQLTILGSPTGGTWDMGLNIFGVTETLTFDWDMTATDIQTEFESHSEVGAGNVQVTGGPFPDGAVTVEFKGVLAKYAFPLPEIDFAALTGGSGVGVIAICYHGHPKDGSVAA